MQKNTSTASFKPDYEAPMQTLIALTQAAIESSEKFVEVNLRHTKARLQDSGEAIKELVSATDPQAYAAFAARHAQPEINKAIAHYLEVAGVASAMQASLAKIVGASVQSWK